jgi:hypothetical protein
VSPVHEDNKKGKFDPPPFVNLRDLEKDKSGVDEPSPETKHNLFISKEEDAWDGYDSDAGEMDLDDDDMSGSDADAEGDTDDDDEIASCDADAEGDTDDETPIFAPKADKDVVMSAATNDEQQILKVGDEQEKNDSPMMLKQDEDANANVDVDAEDGEETKIFKVDENDDDVDMGGGT